MKENERGLLFQADWFSRNIPVWENVLGDFKGRAGLRFLEIGSFEGRSTVWMLNHILTHKTSRIICIDTFEGSREHQEMGIDTNSIETTFLHNINTIGAGDKVTVVKRQSQEALRTLPFASFDFAYIDGSHVASDVLSDAVLTFPLLKTGGVLCFDDYQWDLEPNPLHRPKMAIKAFLEIYQEHYELLHKYDQLFVKKTA